MRNPLESDYFRDSDGRLSMTRLLTFLSFWPAAWVTVEDGTGETLGWFLGAFAGAYAAGKFSDALANKASPVNISQPNASSTVVNPNVQL